MYIYIRKRTLWVIAFSFIIIISSILIKLDLKPKAITTDSPSKAYIALVIDDIGDYDRDGLEELINLDIPLTGAIMPFLENTASDAETCYKAGLEIILHLPMEATKGSVKWLGPRPIITGESNEEVREIVEDALKEVKYAKGINNHMGSKVMQDNRIMTEVLNIVKEKNLFFLDSRTGEFSVAEELCQELNIEYLTRDVFLDHIKKEKNIEEAMDMLGNIALKKGYAIGIGHVGGQGGEITMKIIDKKSKELKKKGIEFIYLSEIKNIINKE